MSEHFAKNIFKGWGTQKIDHFDSILGETKSKRVEDKFRDIELLYSLNDVEFPKTVFSTPINFDFLSGGFWGTIFSKTIAFNGICNIHQWTQFFIDSAPFKRYNSSKPEHFVLTRVNIFSPFSVQPSKNLPKSLFSVFP